MTILLIVLWAWAIGATVGFWSCLRGWQKCNEEWAGYCKELIDQRLMDHVRAIHKPKEEVRA